MVTRVPPIYVIGNPANRRVAYFQQAMASRGLPPAIVHSYHDRISNSRSLEDIIVPGSIVRIDSPGEDFEVEKLLLREGAEVASQEGSPWLDVGRIDRRHLAALHVGDAALRVKNKNIGALAMATAFDRGGARIAACRANDGDALIAFF